MDVDWFAALPEGCISDILSFTSPLDAGRASTISWGFKSAAEADNVWERFLPSDYHEIILRSVSPVVYSSKKGLYRRLCESPIILDGGTMSFSIDKGSGKKCYMLGARELSIAWGGTSFYWKWASHPGSRFSEVAELLSVCWLDIRGKVGTQMLSPKTTYAAYLVFNLSERSQRLESARAAIRFVNEREDVPYDEASIVYLKSQTSGHEHRQENGLLPQRRIDGWMEVKTGEFFNDQGDDGEVETRLMEIKHLLDKSGLIVEGIEFRPTEHE